MGAHQSSSRERQGDEVGPAKTCYYELLEVARDAPEDEIKRAYKKKALLLHPDRNFGDVENATQRFAEIQTAYEVLSDAQERAWYDSHREAILRGTSSDDANGDPPEFNNIKLTSTEDILSLIRRFNAAVPFTDEPNGFFSIVAETFAHLADEETAAGDYNTDRQPDYPPFGESSDSYETVVRPFYTGWAGFSTRKAFSWKDKYRLSDAPDRRIRRLMEKENKKLRDDAVRDFNEAVRFLVTFVRKRDPRYLPNQQTNAERQATLRDAAAAQAARSRAANQQKLNTDAIPTWAQSQTHDEQATVQFSESEEESEVEHIECVVCDKVFKSEKSYEAHEKSKKHLKAVQQLRRQMQKDNVTLDLDTPDNAAVSGSHHATHEGHNASSSRSTCTTSRDAADHSQIKPRDETRRRSKSTDSLGGHSNVSSNRDSDEDDDYVARTTAEQRFTSRDTVEIKNDPVLDDNLQDLTLSDKADERAPSQRKKGKAKEKRAKKAAREAASGQQTNACSYCDETFPSKTKLFNHIREMGHAGVKSVSTSYAGQRNGRIG